MRSTKYDKKGLMSWGIAIWYEISIYINSSLIVYAIFERTLPWDEFLFKAFLIFTALNGIVVLSRSNERS